MAPKCRCHDGISRQLIIARVTVSVSPRRGRRNRATKRGGLKMAGNAGTALIAIDVQVDFCPGGALEVAEGHEVVPLVNAMAEAYPVRVLTQDWHPESHASFAANHAGAEPFSVKEMPYGSQVLWPSHCVQGSPGAQFHDALRTDLFHAVIRKGFRPEIDSYSAFFENDRETRTGLDGYLRERGVDRLVLVGLATDFCVAWSALDARRLGYAVTVVEEAARAIDLDGSLGAARTDMRAAGVNLVETVASIEATS